MSTFFSGTDTSTLQSEGNDTNCFVSLIVNNAGTYCAAITRKVNVKKKVVTKDLGSTYKFFGEGEWTLDPANPINSVERSIDETTIEYFMLDVHIEHVDNPLDYLDTRFEEIEAKKKAVKVPVVSRPYVDMSGPSGSSTAEDQEFYDWIHSSRKASAEAKEAVLPSANSLKQPSLFSEEVMDGLIDASKWEPDPTIIHHLVCQLVTCSLIVNKDIDLKQWIKVHMKKKYDEIFTYSDSIEFKNWSESYIEFIVYHYSDEGVPAEVLDDCDTYYSKIAQAIAFELEEYPSNDFIGVYLDVLARYLV